MSSAALILRPGEFPEIRVLECDGPEHIVRVHHYPGTYTPILSFAEYLALPEHVKESRERSGEMIDFQSAQRIMRLIDQLNASTGQAAAHLAEIRLRVLMLQPGCDQEF